MSLGNIVNNKRGQYWLAQFTGWGAYFTLVYFSNQALQEKEYAFTFLGLLMMISIGLTHTVRYIIIKTDWFKNKPAGIVVRVFIASIIAASIYDFLANALEDLFDPAFKWGDLKLKQTILGIIITSIFHFMWHAIYFAYHYIGKSRDEEIKNIQLEASKTEIELKNLKSQLNPHFMFNSMNSIRALIDEDPNRAKFAVTQLSSILRNTLLMGKNKIVSLQEEVSVVKDYLSLEGIRYEERLQVTYSIDETLLDCEVPPMMIQTLVENSIKHGIAKLPQGGQLKIVIQPLGKDKIEVVVENSGALLDNMPKTGIGLGNTNKRLNLLYGDAGQFNIWGKEGTVISRFEYPRKKI